MKSRTICLLLAFLLIGNYLMSQAPNLISNYGFEQLPNNAVVNNDGQINKASGWTRGCEGGWKASPDLFETGVTCGSDIVDYVGLPVNKWSLGLYDHTPISQSKKHYAGFSTNESIKGTITQQLVAGCEYEVSIWAARSNGIYSSCSQFVSQEMCNMLLEAVLRTNNLCSDGKVIQLSNGYMIESNGWLKYSAVFTLTPNEASIYNRIEFRIMSDEVTSCGSKNAFFDDASLSLYDNIEPSFIVEDNICTNEFVEIRYPDVNPSDATVTWQLDGQSFTPSNITCQSGTCTYLLNIPVAGTHVINRTITRGCYQENYQQVVEILPAPVANAGDDVFSCGMRTPVFIGFPFNPNPNNEFSWEVISGEAHSFDSHTDNTGAYVSPEITTTYEQNVINEYGCAASDQVTVYIEEPLDVTLVPFPNNVCIGENVCFEPFINVSALSPGVTYDWNFGNGLTSTDYSPCTSYNSTGTYDISLKVENSCGIDRARREITVVPNPIANIVGKDFICEEDELVYTNILSQSNYTQNWYIDGSLIYTGSQLSVEGTNLNNSMVLTLEVEDQYGCKKESTKSVSVIHPPMATNDMLICEASCATISVLGGSQAGYTYDWTLAGQNVGSGTSTNVCPTGVSNVYQLESTYKIPTVTGYQCNFVDEVVINIGSKPVVTMSENLVTACGPKEVVANVSGGTAPFKYAFNGTSNYVSNNFIYTTPITNDETHTVSVKDAIGCIVSSSILVPKMEHYFGAPSIEIPNVFTPNGDGVNDLFNPYDPTNPNDHNYDAYYAEMIIYDRWSMVLIHEIYTPNDINDGFLANLISWDGRTYSGVKQQDGEYVYAITLYTCSGIYEYIGYFSLFGNASTKSCPTPGDQPDKIHHNEEIAVATTWTNEEHFVEGVLRIKEGASLNVINSNVHFEPGAKIIVERGASLGALKSEFNSCTPDFKWEGIEVHGNALKPHLPAHQGVLDLKETIVRDAVVGVFAGERNDVSQLVPTGSGGIVKINNSTFENNFVAVEFAKYDGYTNSGEIRNSVFVGINNFISSMLSNYHVVANGLNKIDIHGNTFEGGYGAVKINESKAISLVENELRNLEKGYMVKASSEMLISANTFESVKHSISTENTTSVSVSRIEDNKFVESSRAISLKNDDHSKTDISCNEFIDFQEYAVISDASLIKNQGNSSQGCGNKFASASTLLNNCFNHNGAAFEYYFDLSDSTLVLDTALMSGTVIKKSARRDLSCVGNGRSSRLASYSESNASNSVKQSVSTDKKVMLYPNPNNGVFEVYITGDNYSKTNHSNSITIMDVVGHEVYVMSTSSNTCSIDVSSLSKGTYFAKVFSKNNDVEIIRFVVD